MARVSCSSRERLNTDADYTKRRVAEASSLQVFKWRADDSTTSTRATDRGNRPMGHPRERPPENRTGSAGSRFCSNTPAAGGTAR